uniref:Uncharacterized protein n=1 Tax=Triticum urartu TaxID=4572 RepID=A0A8R7V552_TRIUA
PLLGWIPRVAAASPLPRAHASPSPAPGTTSSGPLPALRPFLFLLWQTSLLSMPASPLLRRAPRLRCIRGGCPMEGPKCSRRLHPMSRAAEARPNPPPPDHPLRHTKRKRLALVRAPPPHPRSLFISGRPCSASSTPTVSATGP